MVRAQERPVRADALLGSADKVTGLAALSDSADYLADVIARSGAMDVSSIGGGSRPSSPSRNQSLQQSSAGCSRWACPTSWTGACMPVNDLSCLGKSLSAR